jgi:hypothetical protein
MAFARRRLFFALLLSLPFVYVMFDFVENATILRLLAELARLDRPPFD